MKISDDFKQYLLKHFNGLLPELTEKAKRMDCGDYKTVSFPIMIDGVIDKLTWDVEKQKFVLIEFAMAGEGMETDLFGGNSVFADHDKIKYIKMELE